MKPTETNHHLRKRYTIIMWLCILFGGFMIILFALDAYTVIWNGNSIIQSPFQQQRDHFIDENAPSFDVNRALPQTHNSFNPLRIITSPFSIMFLINGILLLLAGVTISNITREKEVKKIRSEAADMFLLPDEKTVIDVLKKNNYSLTQSQITKETGLGKVQVHRVIKRLESKELLDKHEYGATNKIVLKKEIFE